MGGKARILSAGAVVVRCFGETPRFLLLRVYRYWDFPKGEVEPGESSLEAAIREVREETGLTDLRFPWGPVYVETPPYGRGKVARYYLARSDQGQVSLPIDPQLGRPEHHEFRWMAYVPARQVLNERLRRVLEWARGYMNGVCGPPPP